MLPFWKASRAAMNVASWSMARSGAPGASAPSANTPTHRVFAMLCFILSDAFFIRPILAQFIGASLNIRLPEEHAVGRIGALIPVAVVELFQKRAKLGFLTTGKVHADQHAAVVGAVVAVMEHGDVPVAAHVVEEV